MIQIDRADRREQITELVRLAAEIWHEYYTPIIGRAQVEYMLEKFQSHAAITRQIADGYQYYVVRDAGVPVGYFSVLSDPTADGLMLSKLYVKRSLRSRGIGRKMLEYAEQLARQHQIPVIWLTVNKQNHDSIAWYNHMGFANVGSVVQDIGGGFVMDDYRMEKRC